MRENPKPHRANPMPHTRGRQRMFAAFPSNCEPRPPQARERGVVLVIALLALVVIAALVFFIFNLASHVQRRVEAQQAADAAVTAGAGWTARSLNTVAQNNIQMARTIALINVLDASAEALHPAYHEARALHETLARQMPEGSGREDSLIREQMQPVLEKLARDRQQLEPMKRRLAPFDQPAPYREPAGSLNIASQTRYAHRGRRGRLWRALESLAAHSRGTLTSLGRLAAKSAGQIGRANLPADDAAALLATAEDGIPWREAQFDAFARPVREGVLPEGIDHEQTNRGPFDALFGWRRRAFEWKLVEPGKWHGGESSDGSGPRGPGQFGPDPEGGGGYWETRPEREKISTGYHVLGPQDWMLQRLDGTDYHYSQFNRWRDLFAQWKLQYLFEDRAARQHHRPNWKTSWSAIRQAVGGLESDGEAVEKARYVTFRIESDVPARDGGFLRPGSYRVTDPGDLTRFTGDWSVPDDPCRRQTHDPRAWQMKLEQYRQHCEAFQQLSQTRQEQWKSAKYTRLGRKTWRFGSKMQRDGQTAYQYVYYHLLGVDVGEPRPVRNPHNFPDRDALPGPMVLDRRALPQNPAAIRQSHMMYFAVARQSNAAPFWPKRFDSQQAEEHAVGTAQAQLFNDHSFDLWTPMWQSRLQPVSSDVDWASRVTDAANQNQATDPDIAADISAYLRRTEDLAEVMLSH
jgi:hypothetical protein